MLLLQGFGLFCLRLASPAIYRYSEIVMTGNPPPGGSKPVTKANPAKNFFRFFRNRTSQLPGAVRQNY